MGGNFQRRKVGWVTADSGPGKGIAAKPVVLWKGQMIEQDA